MDVPTRDELKAVSPLLRENWPGDGPDLLSALGPVAASLVASITGRAIGDIAGEEVPEGLVGVAVLAIAMKSAQVLDSADEEVAADVASGRRLKGFTAGPYSESYFGPGELVVKGGTPQLDADPRLAELLWVLCTEDKREEYLMLANGQVAPYAEISSLTPRGLLPGYYSTVGIGSDGF